MLSYCCLMLFTIDTQFCFHGYDVWFVAFAVKTLSSKLIIIICPVNEHKKYICSTSITPDINQLVTSCDYSQLTGPPARLPLHIDHTLHH